MCCNHALGDNRSNRHCRFGDSFLRSLPPHCALTVVGIKSRFRSWIGHVPALKWGVLMSIKVSSGVVDTKCDRDDTDGLTPRRSQGTEDVPLIPVRMLNEFAYCPRLCYLEWVQGEWAENLETLEGAFGHRNVDRSDRRPVAAGQSHDAAGVALDPDGEPLSEDDFRSDDVACLNRSRRTIPSRPIDPFTLPQAASPVGARGPFVEVLDEVPAAIPTDRNGEGSADSGSRRRSADPADSIHARTIHLSGEREGLVAKLDLLELEGNHATPVDYKRGKIPNNVLGAWEPERVQLCAQGLILRENGYDCPEGVLYFIASKRRVVVPFDDELVARTRTLVAQLRQSAAAGVLPPPLEDSPKCPRCSLVAICLPDEVNFLKTWRDGDAAEAAGPMEIAAVSVGDVPDATEVNSEVHALAGTAPMHLGESVGDALLDLFSGNQDPPQTEVLTVVDPTMNGDVDDVPALVKRGVRKLLPELSQALPLYVQHQGAIVGKTGERITVKCNAEELTSLRLIDVSQVCTFGNVTLTAHAIRELTMRHIPICHFSYGGWFHSLTTGLIHKNVELRIRQYQLAGDSQMSLRIARQLIAGKIRNCRTLLRRHLRDRTAPVLTQLAEFHRRVLRAESAETLLGLEGMAAKEYFAVFFSLLPDRPEFDVDGRNRRPPRDPVNAVLSFVYALLTKELTATLQSVGFDPLLGFFHRPRYGRPSLALDLMEEFRPLIADSTTLMVFNNGEVSTGSFVRRAGAVAMTDAGRKAVIAAYERRLEQEVTHPLFGYRVCYRRILEVQARLLARHVLVELDEYPSFTTR